MSMRASCLALLLAGLPIAHATRPAAPPRAIVGATVLNPGETPLQDAVVLLRDGRIEAVGRRGELAVPPDYVRTDAAGRWLAPGYVDAHVHLFQSGGLYARPDGADLQEVVPYALEVATTRANLDDTLRRYLRSGITTVFDAGGPRWNYAVREAAGESALAPRVLTAGPLISTWQAPVLTEAEDPPILHAPDAETARRLVAAQVADRPDFVKVWFVVAREASFADGLATVQAAITEAHRHGLRAALHADTLETARAALAAGADMLVHGVTDRPIDDAFVEAMRAGAVPWTATLGVYQGHQRVFFRAPGWTTEELAWGSPDAIATIADLDRLPPDLVPDVFLQAWQQGAQPTPPLIAEANLMRLVKAGAAPAVGTDAGNPGTLHGASYFRELGLMAEAGMTPAQILEAATRGGARLLGLEQEIGRIAPGFSADLVLLAADPLADVQNFARIDAVVRNGHLFEADAILAGSSPQETPRNPDAFRVLGPEDQPEAVVDRQIAAYNAREAEAFAALYAEDAEVHVLGGTRLLAGREAIRAYYAQQFAAQPKVTAEITDRIAQGRHVIDRERLRGIEGIEHYDAIAIYEIHRGLIRRVWFP